MTEETASETPKSAPQDYHQILPDEVIFSALELVGEAMIVADRTGTIRYANEQFQTMTEWARSEVMGQKIEILLPDGLKEVHVGHRTGYFDNPVRRPMGRGLDLKVRHKTGALIAVEINLMPRFWPGVGTVVGALLMRRVDANP